MPRAKRLTSVRGRRRRRGARVACHFAGLGPSYRYTGSRGAAGGVQTRGKKGGRAKYEQGRAATRASKRSTRPDRGQALLFSRVDLGGPSRFMVSRRAPSGRVAIRKSARDMQCDACAGDARKDVPGHRARAGPRCITQSPRSRSLWRQRNWHNCCSTMHALAPVSCD